MINAGAHFVLIHDDFTSLSILPQNFVSNFLILHYRNISRQLKKDHDIILGVFIPKVAMDQLSLIYSENLDILVSPCMFSSEPLPSEYKDFYFMGNYCREDYIHFNRNENYKNDTSLFDINNISNNRLIIASNGEIPLDTPVETIESIINSATNHVPDLKAA